jgi:sphingomyelin phosphodiesterase acid-like 3
MARHWGGVLALLITLTFLQSVPVRARADDAPWLVVSDVHYDPRAKSHKPATMGLDSNAPLLDSLLAELKRADPDAPVIFMTGDFLAHDIRAKDSTATMAYLARRFDQTFPKAQFVIALGNNDSDCGDYQVSLGGNFLHAVALAWAPLVNRHGAAPNFARDFSRDGGYTATLPRPGLRAVAFNDVYATLRYRDACGHSADPATASLTQLARTLASGPRTERSWLVMHVPPGIDAFSTAHLAHRLFVVPFLRGDERERLTSTIDAPQNRVSLVIAGHTHKFAYRLSDAGHPDDVPILLAPSVSPIFLNSPSFLELDVAPNGEVRNVAETSYVAKRWQRIGDFASLGMARFDTASIEELQTRLAGDERLRERFATLYSGAGVRDITPKNWRVYWCAATHLNAGSFRPCASEGGYGIFTGRALRYIGILFALAILFFGAIVYFALKRRKTRRSLDARPG